MESWCPRSRATAAAFLLILPLLTVYTAPAFAAGDSARPKNVQVSLQARWPGTPLLLEAGELLSKQWQDLYWDFIDEWLDKGSDSQCSSARSCLQKIVKVGRSMLSEPLGAIFEHSLMIRSASPRLVLYRQLAEDSLSKLLANESGLKFPSVDIPKQGPHSTTPVKTGTNTELSSAQGMCCWVDTGNKLLLNVADLSSWVSSTEGLSGVALSQPEIFSFDHIYHGSSISSPAAILYGALGTECFRKFHVNLVGASKMGKVKYVVRPVLLVGCEAASSKCGSLGSLDAVKLGGYGVELALKNMEYKAIDDSSTIRKGVTLEDPWTEDLSQDVRGFIFSKLLDRKPELRSEILAFRDHLLSSASVSDSLEVWELKDLGHQTTQRIVHASDPLLSMQEINQNFPNVVSLLSRMKLNETIKDEITANQRMVPPGKSLMALNGALINIDDIDIYMMMDLVHEELSLADQLSQLKMPHSAIQKLLSAPPNSESSVVRVDFRSSHVYYLNNLEVDAMYKRWRSNINEILMPVFPGQLRYIRKNLFHAVYVLDPATACGAKSIDLITSMYENSIPMRFGIIMYSSKLIKTIEDNGGDIPVNAQPGDAIKEDLSTLMIQLFIYIKENHDAQLAFEFISNVHRLWGILDDHTEEMLELHHVEGAFVETLLSKAKSLPQETLLKLEKDHTFQSEAEKSSLFVFKLGLSDLRCSLLMNGLVHETTEEALMNAMNEELQRLQELVYYGHINSNMDVLEKFLSESSYKRYSRQILNEGKEKKFVSLSAMITGKDSTLSDIRYFHSPGTSDDLKPITHLLLINVTSKKGLSLLHEGIRYLKGGTERARLGILFNVKEDADSPAFLLSKVFNFTASFFSHKGKVLDFLDQLCSLYASNYLHAMKLGTEAYQLFIEKVSELAKANGLPSEPYKDTLVNLNYTYVNKIADYLCQKLELESGANAVITNGRVIIPFDGSPFLSEDLVLLESMEYEQRSNSIMKIIEEVKWVDVDPDDLTSEFISNLIMLVSSSISTRERSSERARFEILHDKYSAVVLNKQNSSIHIDAVIDPLSASGQRLTPILHILWKLIKPSMRIIFNPMSSLVDLPLKNYYRYVSPTADDFSNADYIVNGPKAFFSNMPLSKTLTMNLDVPEPWLVEPVIAVHDLDNILLENLGEERTLQAVFELEALVLTGHCSEKDHEPPRGLQLILGSKSMPHLVDTLVMANLGYWQMKVSPGVWYLQTAPGRSSDLYELKEKDHTGPGNPPSNRIIIDDLRGKLVHLEVAKKKGKEHEQLLASSPDESQLQENEKRNANSWNANLLKWASGLISGNGKNKSRSEDLKTSDRHGRAINIFSIASGHLYERFLKIMMLSVLKNTRRPVKFWFIKNYLSPQFKDVIPHMAREYGFDYELITYKWPTWLHKQKEKQRIIWAYKILFLDVIFPLSLEKVIFVDADQVVRADMGELYDMDIKGKPLAYTPFCDNNRDMDGYRFWRQGFWKDHLRGKPYHISALYVVDLAKFRQTASGDTLRVFYETLSKDPNSLSNLDQDLPNYAQHTVPIFSLPQEWLWCESWCGNATKSRAKTIDLCNNPMTKEPKLQGARRIILEWVDLDAEARRVTENIIGEDSGPCENDPAVPPPVDNVVVKTEDDTESRSEL